MSLSNFFKLNFGSFTRGLDTNSALTVSVCPFSEVGSSEVDGIGLILGVETAGNTASSRAITKSTLSWKRSAVSISSTIMIPPSDNDSRISWSRPCKSSSYSFRVVFWWRITVRCSDTLDGFSWMNCRTSLAVSIKRSVDLLYAVRVWRFLVISVEILLGFRLTRFSTAFYSSSP